MNLETQIFLAILHYPIHIISIGKMPYLKAWPHHDPPKLSSVAYICQNFRLIEQKWLILIYFCL
jgi:hypothetical protein